jgi:hypothetical protein
LIRLLVTSNEYPLSYQRNPATPTATARKPLPDESILAEASLVCICAELDVVLEDGDVLLVVLLATTVADVVESLFSRKLK